MVLLSIGVIVSAWLIGMVVNYVFVCVCACECARVCVRDGSESVHTHSLGAADAPKPPTSHMGLLQSN